VIANESDVLAKIKNFVENSFAGRFDIYDACFKSANRQLILEVRIDSPIGIKVEDCENVSRSLEKYLDEIDLIHSKYTLEVSSPGVERVLKRNVDYERQIGRLVKWILHPLEGEKKEILNGRLQEFSIDRIVIQAGDGLKEFPLSRVQEARAVLEFPSKNKAKRG